MKLINMKTTEHQTQTFFSLAIFKL